MNKATRDFESWIAGIKGIEKVNSEYERGRLSLAEYIDLARKLEEKAKENTPETVLAKVKRGISTAKRNLTLARKAFGDGNINKASDLAERAFYIMDDLEAFRDNRLDDYREIAWEIKKLLTDNAGVKIRARTLMKLCCDIELQREQEAI